MSKNKKFRVLYDVAKEIVEAKDIVEASKIAEEHAKATKMKVRHIAQLELLEHG